MANDGGGHQVATQREIELMRQQLLPSMSKDIEAVLKLLNESAGEDSRSIFRVPQALAGGIAEASLPRIVSIGPYHHGESLQMFQVDKWRYLHTMLERTQPHGYVPPDRILLINSNSFVLLSLGRNLLRLENQIPYFVLEDLFEMTSVSGRTSSLDNLAFRFFSCFLEGPAIVGERPKGVHLLDLFRLSLIPTNQQDNPVDESSSYHMIKSASEFCRLGIGFKRSEASTFLEIIFDSRRRTIGIPKIKIDHDLNCILPNMQIIGPEGRRSSYELIGSASELNQAGIAFARREASTFLEIKVDSKTGIMQIPKLRIDDTLQCILHNMVAFERCFVYCDKHLTPYAIFMGSLIDTANDAQLSCDHGIMWNDGVSKKGIASFFRDVSKDAVWDVSKSYLESEIARVNSYVRHQQIRVFFTQLIYTPCRYTWSTIAAVLMLTGAIQTVYTVLQYYHPR
ncbi:hypothetical protein EUGRSUZ_E03384 [Eucalyptus grandis]|uniref:Uncharacterized protein n=3 Tax=Eucalyptus grandis TaxID=71139 RepID=A0A059C8G0_EUCGR|nr:hypothetical protein EUGRSUZ_E03384 [Eucalyptus grandis]